MPIPRKVNGNSKGEGNFKSPTFLKESMTLEWNFWKGGGGGGVQFKKPSVGGVWIFSGTTMFYSCENSVSRKKIWYFPLRSFHFLYKLPRNAIK